MKINLKMDKKKVFIKRKLTEAKSVKSKKKVLNESAQIGDDVIFNRQKGSVIGQIGGDLIIQVQGSSHMAKPGDVQVLGAKVKTMAPPFKFSKETQKLLFEQYVRCGIFMDTVPVKTSNCYVRYSDWSEARDQDPINVVVEGQANMMSKGLVRIFEDVNNFGNLDNYIEGVIIDEATGEAVENVSINAIDFTEAIGDADGVRIIRGGQGDEPVTDTVPKASLKTLSV